MKVAVVTGAGRSIGRAIAHKLSDDGYLVIVNSYSQDNANKVVSEIQQNGGKAIALPFDVSDYNQVQENLKAITKEYKQIHVLVNNAGITKDNLLLRLSEQDIDKVLKVNLYGTIFVTKFLLRNIMKTKGASIINVSSVIGLIGNIGQSNYAASKAGIIGFSKSLAKEVASRGVRVNVIAPGFIKTDMTSALPDKVKEELLKSIPLGFFGEVEDVANLVSFLVSDKARYITGQVINLDGGMVI